MIFSGYVIRIPYWITWRIIKAFRRKTDTVFYAGSVHDYYLIDNVLPFLEHPIRIVVKNKNIAKTLQSKGIKTSVWPTFPDIVIMPRHAFHKFPLKAIRKIGMRHGPYHFKQMINAEKYNAFGLFLFTSEHEAELARKAGIQCGVAGGYPRLDVFHQKKTQDLSQKIKNTAFFDPNKPTLLFTTTWDKSGLSAIDRWIDHIEGLITHYNIIVSLHPAMSHNYILKIKNMQHVRLATTDELPACMIAADFLISDTSSVIAEFCALNKPIITFKVNMKGRLTQEITEMIQDVSIQISDIRELNDAIEEYISFPGSKEEARTLWNKRFFDDVTMSHGLKAAKHINAFISNNST